MHIRAFFSVELPSPVKQIIADPLIVDLQKNLADHAIRWTKMENLHITLQFIKEIDALDVEKLIQNVKIELENAAPFFLNLGELELFPKPSRPRIISIAIGPEDTLTRLSKQVGNGILKTNYPIEMRPFRGHLTLGRINEFKPRHLTLENIPLPDFGKIPISDVILFRSEPSESGSHYTELAKFVLGSVA